MCGGTCSSVRCWYASILRDTSLDVGVDVCFCERSGAAYAIFGSIGPNEAKSPCSSGTRRAETPQEELSS